MAEETEVSIVASSGESAWQFKDLTENDSDDVEGNIRHILRHRAVTEPASPLGGARARAR